LFQIKRGLSQIFRGISQGAVSEATGGSFRSGFWAGSLGSAVPVDAIKGKEPRHILARTMAASVVSKQPGTD